jgi:predicted amidohydrolase YtcJ
MVLPGFDPDREYVLRSEALFTMRAGDRPQPGFVHIGGGRIVATGSKGSEPEAVAVVDVGDRPVLPGFVDPHIHLEQASAALYGTVDCDMELTGSIDAVIETMRADADRRDQRGGWLIGQSNLFTDRRIAERRMPNRADMDRVSTEYPVVLKCGAHITACNSVALQRILDADLNLRPDQVIDRDQNGPTGVIRELYHELGVPDLTTEDAREALRRTSAEKLTANGVTTIGEITDTVASMQALHEVSTSGDVPQRIQLYVCAPWTMPFDQALAWAADNKELGARFRSAGLKIFADGGFSAKGAAVLTPYLGVAADVPDALGRLAYTVDDMYAMIAAVQEAGLQLAVHANGERGQQVVAEAAVKLPNTGLPVRIEHAGNFVSRWDLTENWHRPELRAVCQPAFLWMMSSFLPEYLGELARAGRMPYRTLMSRGFELSASSDATGSDRRAFSPLAGITMMAERVSCTGELIDSDERLEPMDGLAMYTCNAAAAMGLTGTVGELREGARADLVVLDRDPRNDIARTQVSAVIIDGRPEYDTGPVAAL